MLAPDEAALEAVADDAALDDAADDAADEAALDDAAEDAAELAVDAEDALPEALLALDDDADEHPTAAANASAHTDATATAFKTCIDFMASPFPWTDGLMVSLPAPDPPVVLRP